MTDAQLAKGNRIAAELRRLHKLMQFLGTCEIVNVKFTKKTETGTRDEALMELTMEEIQMFRNALRTLAQKKEKDFAEL